MEILDPSIADNFYPDHVLVEKADGMLNSSFIDLMSEEMFQETVMTADHDADRSEKEVEYLRCIYFIEMTGSYCLAEVMSDQNARSEYHIAGEMCRLNLVLQTIGRERGITELIPPADLDVVTNLGKSGEGFWVPDGTTAICPTIDGLSPTEPRIKKLSERMGIAVPSYHKEWLDGTLGVFRDFSEVEFLNLLRPPFMLNSGEIIAEDFPNFYSQRSKSDVNNDAPLETAPPDLLLV